MVNIGSGNGSSPVQRQAITWTNVDFCKFDPQEALSVLIQFFIEEHASEHVFCKRSTIVFRHKYVDVKIYRWFHQYHMNILNVSLATTNEAVVHLIYNAYEGLQTMMRAWECQQSCARYLNYTESVMWLFMYMGNSQLLQKQTWSLKGIWVSKILGASSYI